MPASKSQTESVHPGQVILSHTNIVKCDDGLIVELLLAKKWQMYCMTQTEMICCRKGRNLFPYLSLRLLGLQQNFIYTVKLYLERIGQKRMAYNQDERLWSACGEEEPYREPSCYQSNLGPKLGQFLNGREISFKHVKIVNCKPEKTEHLLVQTKCLYQPVFVVECVDENKPKTLQNKRRFAFSMTKFIAVTAYRNPSVVDLKIDTNPKARAFKLKKIREDPDVNENHMDQAQLQQLNGFHVPSNIHSNAPNMNYNPFQSQIIMNSFPTQINYRTQPNLPHNSKEAKFSGFMPPNNLLQYNYKDPGLVQPNCSTQPLNFVNQTQSGRHNYQSDNYYDGPLDYYQQQRFQPFNNNLMTVQQQMSDFKSVQLNETENSGRTINFKQGYQKIVESKHINDSVYANGQKTELASGTDFNLEQNNARYQNSSHNFAHTFEANKYYNNQFEIHNQNTKATNPTMNPNGVSMVGENKAENKQILVGGFNNQVVPRKGQYSSENFEFDNNIKPSV